MIYIIAILKLITFLIWCFFTIITQSLGWLLLQKTPYFYVIPKLYHRVTCKIFNIRVHTTGDIVDGHVLFAGNHLSYIDISTVGSVLDATFISKEDVKHWPIFGILATVGKTIFISRERNAAEKCISDIQSSLNQGRSLILFPEGTSSNGTSILPFKSSLFEIFLSKNLKEKLTVQPFTISISKINQRADLSEKDQDIYAWYGDMALLPHLWQIAQQKSIDIQIEFHAPLRPTAYDNRKDFALDCQNAVASGLE